MQNGIRRPGRRKQFTLLELLIVIAIISVLAAMLLPALNKARDKAKSSACIGNLKQIGVYSLLYADDYDGWIVPAQQKNPGPDTTINDIIVGTDLFWAETLGAYYIRDRAGYISMFSCPAMPEKMGGTGNYPFTHYGVAPYVSGSLYGTYAALGGRRISSVRRPSEWILAADFDRQTTYAIDYPSFVYPRHHTFYSNCLYLAGQVSSTLTTSITKTMIGK